MKRRFVDDELKENNDIGQGLVQMYQAGFLDGWNFRVKQLKEHRKTEKPIYTQIMDECKKAFEFRFVNKLQGKIKMGCSGKKKPK